MIEVYVYLEGLRPVEVVLGRRAAVDRLLAPPFKTTSDERKRISLFLEGPPCDLGTGITVVGFPPDIPDRRIVRVIGPGAEV